jgi:signal transduction histidine kinase
MPSAAQDVMKGSADLSVGQRLWIGFGAVLIVVATLLILVFQWHAASSRAEANYSDRIVPLIDRAQGLERAIYEVGLRLRARLLEPTEQRLQAFELSERKARSVLDALGRSDLEADGRELLDGLSPAVDTYLRFAENVVERNPAGSAPPEDEAQLRTLRENVLGLTRDFSSLQDTKAAAALEKIAAVRERTSKSLLLMALAAALMLAALAELTTRSVRRPAQTLLATANALSEGDWKPALALAKAAGRRPRAMRNEMARLADAFAGAAVALEQREQRLRADGLVAKAVAGTLSRDELCEQALHEVVSYVGAQIGVLYSKRESGLLEPIATYALAAPLAAVRIGEGVPGQAAYGRRPVVLKDIPADSGFQVRLGYDQALPKSIAAVPLLFKDAVHGVLLVGSLDDLSADAVAFLEAAATQLGIGLHNIAAHEETQRLLNEVRASNERIQAQNEQLQVQNEEIQAQNEQIQTQSEELQAQHEEIQAQNEELLQQGEELRRHIEQLAEADAHKNQFLGVLAHELRNPMTPIANSIFLLKRSAPGSETALHAQAVIERQVAHLVRLIDDLLDVTRISEGKIRIQREALDLAEVVHTCADDLYSAFEQSNIELDLVLPDAPVTVSGDGTRLTQVLGNLLMNSIKFSDGGKVRVELHRDDERAAAVLRVIDEGIGIEQDLLPKLFQPFSQGVSGLARVNGGLGLGLALVKALVTLHGGEVSAHSKGRGCGAEFTVRLPLAAEAKPEEAEAAPKEAGALPAAPAIRRVLVIEDNIDAAATLRVSLELERFEVAVAHSGPEGLETAAAFRSRRRAVRRRAPRHRRLRSRAPAARAPGRQEHDSHRAHGLRLADRQGGSTRGGLRHPSRETATRCDACGNVRGARA